ncbi:hypothetical protein EGI16_21465 [Chryseobacterium sp. G0240]|uniref:hypothetical protein n=1 Tax=Chryseobacterium sp. G0240 TaxID=2487066 RepID=UPI000F451CB0|nr:hypothetical protein [Chryseobacterium sp. G0240]ROH98406.1 hypothetical protein EGI16_21465 [Chryseobacterium sp. G0240]
MSDLFKQYPDLSHYYETSDGTPFYKEETAQTYAKTLNDKRIKAVYREDIIDEEGPKTETAKEIIAKLPDMDLETAQDYLTAEESLETPRTTVVAAIQKRIAELQAK